MAQWVLCDHIVSGTPLSLTRCTDGGKPGTLRGLLTHASFDTVRQLARLEPEAWLDYVGHVARGSEEASQWLERHRERARESTPKNRPLLHFLERLGSVEVEIGSLAWGFGSASDANRFRALDAWSRSLLCAVVFNERVDHQARKTFIFVWQGGVDHLQWRELPVLPDVAPSEAAPTSSFGCFTVPLPSSMASRLFRATARSLASHLHFLMRRGKCTEARSWILHIAGNTPLNLSKLQCDSLPDLEDSLMAEGWTRKSRGFSFTDPCFVLICPRHALPQLKVLFVAMLDYWKLNPRPHVILMRDLSFSEPDALRKSILAHSNPQTHLCLRGAKLSYLSLHSLQKLVKDVPTLTHLDLSFNLFSGPSFRTWLYEWLSQDADRRVDITGNPLAEVTRNSAPPHQKQQLILEHDPLHNKNL